MPGMNRKTFLTLTSVIALSVGTIAALFPLAILESKGVTAGAPVIVWIRQVGVALLGIGIVSFLIRGHAPSATIRAFLYGNAAHQLMLTPIEVVAFRDGTITKLSGIVPNTVLHVLLATGFLYFASRERVDVKDSRTS